MHLLRSLILSLVLTATTWGQGAVRYNATTSALVEPTAAQFRSANGLQIGVNVQAYDADLTTWAAISPSANVQTLLNSANYAAFRTALSLVIGSNVQAWDADLDSWATKTAPSGVVVGTTDTQTVSNKTVPAPSSTTITGDGAVMSYDVFQQKWAVGREFFVSPDASTFQTASSGTGSQAGATTGCGRAVAGSTGSGYGAMWRRGYGMLSAAGGLVETCDFSRPMWISVAFSAGYNPGGGNSTSLSPNGIARYTFGKQITSSVTGALGHKGFGFEVQGASGTTAKVRVVTYDTSLHTSADLATIDFTAYASGPSSAPVLHVCTFFLDGAGNMSVFLDGTYLTTVTTAPTGNSVNEWGFVCSVEAGGDTTGSEAYLLDIRGGVD